MERRGFLQAMVTAITATTATLSLKQTDSGLLVPDRAVVLAPEALVPPAGPRELGMLYDAHGHAVLFTREIKLDLGRRTTVPTVSFTGYLVDENSYGRLTNAMGAW